jgi:uncharacterized membrane protein HdeD (DUF308 family)
MANRIRLRRALRFAAIDRRKALLLALKGDAGMANRAYMGPAFGGTHALLHHLAKFWGLLLLRGVCALLFGVLALIWPGATLIALLVFYSTYLIADGVFAIIAVLAGSGTAAPWWLAAAGLASIVTGLLVFAWPGAATLALLFAIGAWAVASGILNIIGGMALRKHIDDEWFLFASGVLAILFGILLIWRPGVGAVSLIWIIGTYSILYGALLTGFALRLRMYEHSDMHAGHS